MLAKNFDFFILLYYLYNTFIFLYIKNTILKKDKLFYFVKISCAQEIGKKGKNMKTRKLSKEQIIKDIIKHKKIGIFL